MMHRYFKMSNVSYRILFDISLFIYKIRIPAMSMVCLFCIRAVSRHHR